MFNVNPFEVVVIAVLFLVLFGPERIPEIAMQAGKFYRDIRQAADAASSEFTREIESAARIGAEEEARKKAEARAARRAADADVGGAAETGPGTPELAGPIADENPLETPADDDEAGP
jgi:Sec-independent protein translocase protein TatA